MGNDISSGLSFRAVCFDFCSTKVGSSVIGTHSTTGFDVILYLSFIYIQCISLEILTSFPAQHKCSSLLENAMS